MHQTFQIGGSTIFTAILSYAAKMSLLNWKMMSAIMAVVVGTLLSCASILKEDNSFKVDLIYLFGIGMALLTTMCMAMRNVLEEQVFIEHKQMGLVLLSAVQGLFGNTLIGAILVAAQLMPGDDHGVQV